MAIALVQSKIAVGTGTTPTVTMDAPPTAGNTVIAVVGARNASAAWTPPTGFNLDVARGQTANAGAAIYSRLTLTGDSATVSNTISASVIWNIVAYEFSGVGSLDNVVSNGSATVTSWQVASGTPSNDTSLAIAAWATVGATGGSEAIDSSFTAIGVGTFTSAIIGHKLKATGAAEAPTASWTTSRAVTAVMAFYRPDDVGWLKTMTGMGK